MKQVLTVAFGDVVKWSDLCRTSVAMWVLPEMPMAIYLRMLVVWGGFGF